MMTGDYLVWRCLHGGALTTENLEHTTPHPAMDWPRIRTRNLPLMRKLTELYGSCAVLARDGEAIVGMIRFYPKAIWQMNAPRGFCMQQCDPAGPADTFAEAVLPPLQDIDDKTLQVHCLTVGSPGRPGGDYQRKGIASRMVRELERWARERVWQAIEAAAYEELPTLYAVTGNAGRRFWEKLGYTTASVEIEQALTNDSDFTRTLRREAAAAGLREDDIVNRYRMRRQLRPGPDRLR
jgi:hypothetical protein